VFDIIWWFCISSQQECEKLREIAEMLKSEISELPNELRRLSEECGKLDEENSSLIVCHLNSTYSLSFTPYLKNPYDKFLTLTVNLNFPLFILLFS
jgi:hypothetical protein